MFIHVFWLELRVVFVSHSEFLILNLAFPQVPSLFLEEFGFLHLTDKQQLLANFSSFKLLPGVKKRLALLALQQSDVPSFVSVPSQDPFLTDPQRLLIL